MIQYWVIYRGLDYCLLSKHFSRLRPRPISNVTFGLARCCVNFRDSIGGEGDSNLNAIKYGSSHGKEIRKPGE